MQEPIEFLTERFVRSVITEGFEQPLLDEVVASMSPRSLLSHTAMMIGTAIGYHVATDWDTEDQDLPNMFEQCELFLETLDDAGIRDLYQKEKSK